MKKLYIRADGNHRIGLGHIIRCLSLAETLLSDFEVTFFSIDFPENKIDEFIEKGLKVVIIEKEDDFFLAIKEADYVILDIYHSSSDYEAEIKQMGVKLVCIDDLHNHFFHADMIINHSPNVTEQHYDAVENCKFLLGYEYALLNKSFIQECSPKVIDKFETALICFGGSDPRNLTPSFCKLVLESKRFKRINIITGSSYNNSDELNKLFEKEESIRYYHNITHSEMKTLFNSSSICFLPTSTVLIEAASQNSLIIAGYVESNHKHVYQGAINNKSIFGIGNYLSVDQQLLLKKIKSLEEMLPIRIENTIGSKTKLIKDELLKL